MGAPLTTAAGDFFTFNVNGTPYTAITNGATSTLNITTLVNTLTAWLDASLPNHSVTSNASSITIEADNTGVAFTVTTLSSSTFSGNSVNVRPPAYFEISGTASSTSNNPQDYEYTLSAVGPGCAGGFAASGTITINPHTFGVPVSDPNPVYCDNTDVVSGTQFITYYAPNAITISQVTPTTQPSWITANKIGTDIIISVEVPDLAITAPVTYTYAYNLIGNAFGCLTTPTPISGVVTISPKDIITFADPLEMMHK